MGCVYFAGDEILIEADYSGINKRVLVLNEWGQGVWHEGSQVRLDHNTYAYVTENTGLTEATQSEVNAALFATLVWMNQRLKRGL